MSRHSSKKKNYKNRTKLTGILVAGAVLAAGGAASLAAFSDSGSSAVTVQAGSITLAMGATGTAKTAPIDLGTGWYPTKSEARTVVIRNTGTLPMTVTGSSAPAASANLAPILDVAVKKDTASGASVATGKASTLAIPAQVIPAGGTLTLHLTYTWPNGSSTVDNALMGASGNSTITFTGSHVPA